MEADRRWEGGDSASRTETEPARSPLLPVLQPLLMRVRRAWHTVILRSGRSLMAIPRVRAIPLKDARRSTGHVQKPGSMVQIWRGGKRPMLADASAESV